MTENTMNRQETKQEIYRGIRRAVGCCLLAAALPHALTAQVSDPLYTTDYRLMSEGVKELKIEVENLNFFKNNEYAGDVMEGYTLPGLWVIPKLTYQPLNNLKVELGAYGTWYSGAYKYPNYAYQDIASWKGTQYQQGAHILPYFRARLALGDFNLVFGNLYGGGNHRLIRPLYDPELNLTADPESGFQLLYDRPRFHLDAWINWQSYIFDIDTHQEAFAVGLSTQYSLNEPTAPLHGYLKVQGTIQHRGGEIDESDLGVQTWANGALGGGLLWNLKQRRLHTLNLEVNLLGYLQQSGDLWPYDRGAALYTSATATFGRGFRAEAGYFLGKHFISIFGIPYFGAVSTDHEGACFDKLPQTLFLALDWEHTVAKNCVLGAKAQSYTAMPGDMRLNDGTVQPVKRSFNFDFGVYLRTDFSFLLKKF